jgi:hypothetical protein
VMVVASAFTLIPRDIWTIRSDDMVTGEPGAGAGLAEPAGLPGTMAGAVADLGVGAGSGTVSGASATARAGADLGSARS